MFPGAGPPVVEVLTVTSVAMNLAKRGAVAAAVCVPLLLGACTIGDPDGDSTSAAPEDTAESESEVPEDVPEDAPDPEPDADPVDTDPDAPGARGLAVGDCVADLDQLDSDTDIDLVDCAEPHAGEVYRQADIAGKNLFPGNEPLGQEAGTICADAFTDYVGVGFPDSTLDVITMMPSKESWAQGDRTVTCVVTDPNLPEIDGTLGQSWR